MLAIMSWFYILEYYCTIIHLERKREREREGERERERERERETKSAHGMFKVHYVDNMWHILSIVRA